MRQRRNWLLLLVGQTVSQLGSAMTGFAAVIWAYRTTGQVMASSLLAACATAPCLAAGLLGGAVADSVSRKKLLLLCDAAAAAGTLTLLICVHGGWLSLGVLCAVNLVGGLMNAFQSPASQVAVTLLAEERDWSRVGGIQSVLGAAVGILNPILAAGLLSLGGLELVLLTDLTTFLFAFLTLLLFISIPETEVSGGAQIGLSGLRERMGEGIAFVRGQKSILFLLLMYGILNLAGALSFDSMYTPLILARTGGDEGAAGIVSAAAAAGVFAAGLLLSAVRLPRNKVPAMLAGSLLCLGGISLFGMGRSLVWWCPVVFAGCFGAPVYQTCQTVLLRERVPVALQGRVFALRDMLVQGLTPAGYLLGALLADRVLEPFLQRDGRWQQVLAALVGHGPGAGMGLLFVLSGTAGVLLLTLLGSSRYIRDLE